jgi:probable rRNA maturation factor
MGKKGQICMDIDNKIFDFYNEHATNEQKLNKKNIEEKIKKIVEIALEKENINVSTVDVSIRSASKYMIKKLNLEYRNIDRVTDVLSFPIFSRDEIKEFKKNNSEISMQEIELGDIILCLDVILKQSKEYNTGIERELLYMITHGICHLLGYDHEVDTDKIKMRRLEEEILNSIEVYKII